MQTVLGKVVRIDSVQEKLALQRILRQREVIKRDAGNELTKLQKRHGTLDTYNTLMVSHVLFYKLGIRSKKTVGRICRALESQKIPMERAQADIIGRTLPQAARDAMVERNQAAQRNAIGIILGSPEKGELFWKCFKEIREARTPKRKSKRQKK